MDKSLLIFIAIGLGFLYFVTTFVEDIQAEDEAYQNNAYKEEQKYKKYNVVDSIGQDMLDVTGASENMQLDAWNHSVLKEEFLALFPDFSEMKDFTDDRLRGNILKSKLKSKIASVEDKFFTGGITAEDARRELSILK